MSDKVELPDTPEGLHAHAEGILAKPHLHHDDTQALRDIVSHPSVKPETIANIYHKHLATTPKTGTGTEGIAEDYHDIMDHIAEAPATPPAVIEDFIDRTKNSNEYSINSVNDKLVNRPGLNPDTIKGLIDNRLASSNPYHTPITGNLDPDYYMGKIAGYNGLNDTAKDIVNKLSLKFLESGRASPDQMNKISDHIVSNIGDVSDHDDVLNDALNANPQFPREQLSRIFEARKAHAADRYYYQSSGKKGILHHPNIDPATVASAATDPRGKFTGEALSSPSLPDETRKAIVSKIKPTDSMKYGDLSSLLGNPNLSAEEVNHIAKHHTEAFNHPLVDKNIISDWWNRSSKDTGTARSIIGMASTPPDVLKDIIMKHKNMDVVNEAVNHRNVTEDILNEGLTRKAKGVQESIAKHPIMMEKSLADSLLSGKINPRDIFHDRNIVASFAKIDENKKKDVISGLHGRFSGSDYKDLSTKNKIHSNDVLKVKYGLSTSPYLTSEEQRTHKNDIISAFSKDNPPDRISKDHDQLLTGMVKSMAHNEGDKAAQMAMADSPRGRREMSLSHKNIHPDVLDHLANRLNTEGEFRYTDEYGHANAHNADTLASPMSRNPNIRTETLNHLVSKYPDSISGRAGDRSYGYNWAPDENGDMTIFDRHYGHLDDVSKRQQFIGMYDKANPKIDEILLKSKHTPLDLWGNIAARQTGDSDIVKAGNEGTINWKEMPADKKDYALKSEQFKKHIPYITNSLDASKLEDWKVIQDHFVSPNPSGAIRQNVNNIPSEFFHGEKGQQLAESLAKSHPENALTQIAKHIAYGVVGSTKHSYRDGHNLLGSISSDSTPEETKAAIGKMSQMVNQVSGGDPNKAAVIWSKGLKEHEEIPKMLGKLGKSKDGFSDGSFDHVVDQVTDPEAKGLLTDTLISEGLLSKSKMDQLSGDATFTQKLQRANSESIHPLIMDHLTGNNPLTNEDLKTINAHVDPRDLAEHKQSRYRRNKISASDLAKLPAIYDTAIKKIAASPELEPDTIGTFMNNATKSALFASKHGKTLVGNMIKSVDTHIQDPELKNRIFASFYKNAESNTKAAVGKQFLNNITKQAVASNDLGSVLDLIESSPSAPSEAVKYIAKVSKDPTKLNDESFGRLLRSPKMASSSDQLFKTAVDRLNQKIAAGDDPASLSYDIARLVDNTLQGKHYSEKTATSTARTMLDLSSKHSVNLPGMLRGVGALINSGWISDSDSAQLFTALPNDLDNYKVHLTKNAVNSSTVIGSAVNGWKLNTVANHLRDLSPSNADTIVNRLMDSDLGQENLWGHVVTLSENPSVQPETFTKLARSLDNATITKAARNIEPANMHLLQPVISEKVSDAASQINKDVQAGLGIKPDTMGLFTNSIGASGVAISKMTDRYNGGDGDPKAESASIDAIDTDLKSINSIIPHLQKFNDDPSHKDQIQRCNDTISVYVGNILNHNDPSMKPDQWTDLLNVISAENFFKDSKTIQVDQYLIAKRIETWGQRAEGLSTDHWKTAFSKNPSLIMRLDRRPVIDSDLMGAVDFDYLDKVEQEAGGSASATLLNMGKRFTDDAKSKYASKIMNHVANDPDHVDLDTLKAAISQFRSHVDVNAAKSLIKKFDRSDKPDDRGQDEYGLNSLKTWMARSGTGGKEFAQSLVSEVLGQKDPNPGHVESLSHSPFLTNEHVGLIIKKSNSDNNERIIHILAENQDLPSGSADSLYDEVRSGRHKNIVADDIINTLSENRTLGVDTAKKNLKDQIKEWPGYFHHGDEFPGILTNPIHSGNLIRELPTKVPPEVPNIDPKKCPRDIEASPEGKARFQSLLSILPPEGLTWKEIKTKNPQFDAYPDIKKLAIKKQNQPITPEDVANEMKQSAKGDSYHLTYSSWDSHMQKHNSRANPSQLVVQLNNSKQMEDELSKDPKCWAVYQHLQQTANKTKNGEIGMHPTTPQLISWARVDTSDPKSWSIEEFQSDVEHYYMKSLETMIKNSASELKIGNQPISSAELKEYGDRIRKAIKNWVSGQYNAVEQTARQHGIENLFIHGTGVRAHLSGYNAARQDKPLPPALNYRYGQFPKEVGFEECDYNDYPNASPDTHKGTIAAGFNTQCWKKKLK